MRTVTAERRLVVDANVAMKWFVQEPLSEEARILLRGDNILTAPDVLPMEFGNVMAKKLRRGEVEAAEAGKAIERVRALVWLLPSSELFTRAWDLVVQYNRSFYDALYLALAVREGCRLVTADEKLVNGMGTALRDHFLPLGNVPGDRV